MISFLQKIFGREKEEEDPMKYLIVGLGNMHPDYDETRHNVGFEVVDLMAQQMEVEFKNDSLGDLAEGKYKGRKLILLKPSTYMNRSGKSVRHWMTKKKIQLENVLIIVDDKNLDFGTLRLKGKGSDGGHNGLKDINQMVGSNYARLRVGIGSDFQKGRQVDFVLGKWSNKEKKGLEEILMRCSEASKSFCFAGLSQTMNTFNKKG